MLRTVQHVVHAAFFHLAAGVHHDDALAHLGDDAQVVRDQHDGRAQAGLDVAQQVQDLRLDGDVQRGRGFVGDQDLRVAGQRHGDQDALALAAGELVRQAVQAFGRLGDADLAQQFNDAGTALGAVKRRVAHQYRGDLRADGQ
ncbi:hypothetical protein G6F40_016419 [Rhizopus arrhizus]|nr:hypothetical protein G6F40_016419 [Rhizopus arrhizus]